MRERLILEVTVLLLVIFTIGPVFSADAASLTYSSATTLELSTPVTTLTIEQGSVADAITVNAASVVVSLSQATGGDFVITSPSYDLSVATSNGDGGVNVSCRDGIETVTLSQNVGSTLYTITAGGSNCANASPPIVTNIAATNITTNSATITWTTNIAADSAVSYGVTALYGATSTHPALITAHSILLPNLNANTFYHFAVISADYGTSTTSGDNIFMTVAIPSGGGGVGGTGAIVFFDYTNPPSSISTAANLPLTFVANSLVKLPNDGNAATQADSAVYYYGRDGRRHAFPNDKAYFTWYSDFSQVQIISATELSRMPLGQNVTYRPGVRMVKFTTLSRVYAVDAGGVLRWVKTEDVATALYGSTWNQQIDDINDAFYANYRFGSDINSIADFNPSSATAAASSIQVDMGF